MKVFAHPDQRQMAPVDLNQAVQSTLTVASNEYKYVAVLETDFGDLPQVTCHAGEVNQAVLNLVVNAAHAIADHAKDGEKGLIRVRTRQDGDSAVISVSDTGGGIPDSIRDRIFDPFFTTKEVGRGTGQGLSVAHSVIVEKHRGQLSFETERGRGTTFEIRLPIG
jgi:two-component system, NtrC family, sensor kinase